MEKSIQKQKTCIVKGCENSPQLKMCIKHLKNPIRDKIKLSEDIEFEPPYSSSSSTPIQLAHSLLSISPSNLKLNKKAKRRFEALQKESFDRNKEKLIVTELKPCTRIGGANNQGHFYSDINLDDECLSSREFKEFIPMENKDQLVICSESHQLIFFIPCSNSFDRSEQQALKKCLLNSLNIRPNNINKLSKKRRVIADKWAFAGCKFSAFENARSFKSPPGVTKVSWYLCEVHLMDFKSKLKLLLLVRDERKFQTPTREKWRGAL